MRYLENFYKDNCIFKLNIQDISLKEISIDYLIFSDFEDMINTFKSMNLFSKYPKYIKIDVFNPKMINYIPKNIYGVTGYDLKNHAEKFCYHRELYINPNLSEIYGERYYIKTGVDIYIDYGILYGEYNLSEYSTAKIFKSLWFNDPYDDREFIITQDVVNPTRSIFSISNDFWIAVACAEYNDDFNDSMLEFRRPKLCPPISTIILL